MTRVDVMNAIHNEVSGLRLDIVPATSVLYTFQPVQTLPTADLSIMLGAVLLRRSADTALNQRIVSLVQRSMRGLYILMLISCPCAVTALLTSNLTLRILASLAVLLSACPLIIFAFISLSWDIVKLLLRTFEFWFFTSVNLINTLVLGNMLCDFRVLAITTATLFYQLTLFGDANLHTRLLEIRLLVFGAPAMFLIVAGSVFSIIPDLQHTSMRLLWCTIDDMDMLLTGNFILAFFTSLKVHRNRRYLSGKIPLQLVQCQMYFPDCRLERVRSLDTLQLRRAQTSRKNTEWTKRLSGACGEIGHRQQLHLVHSSVTDVIDASRTAFSLEYCSQILKRCPCCCQWASSALLNIIGVLGLGLTVVIQIVCAVDGSLSEVPSTMKTSLQMTGCAFTVVFFVVYAVNFQRELLRILLDEVDVWFASLHVTLVSLCASDIFQWNERVIGIVAAWLWGHWIILLDAVPPSSRRHLGFRRHLPIIVISVLLVYLVSLAYSLFFALLPTSSMHNRVLLDLSISRTIHLRLEMFSFIASKLFTATIWMGRFLWREIVRDHDAFKLIKHRAQFLIPTT